MMSVILVSLRPGFRIIREEPASLILEAHGRRTRLTCLDAGIRDLLLSLGTAPLAWDGQETCGRAAKSGFRQLFERRLVQIACVASGRELMAAAPTGGPSFFDFDLDCAGDRLRMSRFTYLRNLDGELVIEIPQRFMRVKLDAPEVLCLLPALARGESLPGLRDQSPGRDEELISEAARFLAGVGAIGIESGQRKLDDETDPELAPREFHDVVFHSSTRRGLTTSKTGAAHPFLGIIPPTPAIKAGMSAASINLPAPDLAVAMRIDPPLARVMEERSSVRRYGKHDITLNQVSELLYRVARVRSVVPVQPEKGLLYEVTNRTYPSGGATYDLELYLTLRCCEGIASGVYHYQPVEHALCLVCDKAASVDAMLENARRAAGQDQAPPVLITFASRFNRLSWKYRAISYATTLKNVGVLYEAMYLAATAMSLAPCALGCGDAALFSQITGLAPLVESSVGEFMLGTRPAPVNPAPQA